MQRAIQQNALQDGFGAAFSLHAMAHAMSLAFADRAQYLGDSDFTAVPTTTLLSPSYLDKQWKTFKTDQAALPIQAGAGLNESQYTTHLSVIDRYGNAVSLTTTINDNFGSGFVPPGTGVVMNNEMDDFSVQPGIPNLFGLVGNEANAIVAHKRPLSSMSPTIARDSTGTHQIVIGAAGGPRIATSVFLCLLNRLYFDMSLSDSVGAPRIHQQWIPKELLLERFGFSLDTRALLKKKGYSIQEVSGLGKIHALEKFTNGRTWGAPDPRGEGSAVAE